MRPPGFPEITPHHEFDSDEARQEVLSRMTEADAELGDQLLEAPGVSRIEETPDGIDQHWVVSKDIKPLERLQATKGPFVELGGPSAGGFESVDMTRLPRRLVTTNIDVATYGYNEAVDNYVWGQPDLRADGREMPLRDQQVGAIFARYFGGILAHQRGEEPPEELAEGLKMIAAVRGRAIDEAWRMIEPGGVLVWEGGFRPDIAYAAKLGFRPLMLHVHKPDTLGWNFEMVRQGPNPLRVGEFWSAVMEKPTDPPIETGPETA